MMESPTMRTVTLLALLGLGATPVAAQMAVLDNANLQQARSIASNTQAILEKDQAIMQATQKTLQAVTGDRSSLAQGNLAQMALGGGFSMGQAPSLSSVIAGGPLTFAGMSAGSQTAVSNLINGLQLVKTITGLLTGATHPVDQAYQNSVNVTSTLTGLISSTQSAVQKPSPLAARRSARRPTSRARSIRTPRCRSRPARRSTR
jgi:hypothetical protein